MAHPYLILKTQGFASLEDTVLGTGYKGIKVQRFGSKVRTELNDFGA